jgi:hypothetical protein
MQLAEQESLLLRQLAALRRSGLGHGEALALVSPGIVDSGLRARVQAARDALSSGRPLGSDPLLSGGDVPASSLDLAARAVDVQLLASSSLHLFRSYAVLGLVVPLVVLFVLSWLVPVVGDASFIWFLHWSVRAGSLPLMVVGLVLLRALFRRPLPGVRQLELASAILHASVTGVPLDGLLSDREAFLYFSLRRERVGESAAASALAAELSASGNRTVALFRVVAPFLSALLGITALVGVLVALSLSIAGGGSL